VETLGDGGGVTEDAATQAAGDARRDARAAHAGKCRRVLVIATRRGGGEREKLDRRGGGLGRQAGRRPRRRGFPHRHGGGEQWVSSTWGQLSSFDRDRLPQGQNSLLNYYQLKAVHRRVEDTSSVKIPTGALFI
jgi:hypothetical protein